MAPLKRSHFTNYQFQQEKILWSKNISGKLRQSKLCQKADEVEGWQRINNLNKSESKVARRHYTRKKNTEKNRTEKKKNNIGLGGFGCVTVRKGGDNIQPEPAPHSPYWLCPSICFDWHTHTSPPETAGSPRAARPAGPPPTRHESDSAAGWPPAASAAGHRRKRQPTIAVSCHCHRASPYRPAAGVNSPHLGPINFHIIPQNKICFGRFDRLCKEWTISNTKNVVFNVGMPVRHKKEAQEP